MRAADDILPERNDVVGSPPLLVEHLTAVQSRLRDDDIDGWLLYDFRGSNPTAYMALGLEGLMVTRRLMYWIPQTGEPVMLCHTMDQSNLPLLPGVQQFYAGWRDLDIMLRALLHNKKRVAMEVFPSGAIPYLSRVDAGTVDWVKGMEVEVVSSADLVQYFLCRFSEEQAEAHLLATRELDRIKNEAFKLVGRRVRAGYPITEYEVQQFIMQQFSQAGMVTDHTPIVACGPNTADPHYVPSPDGSMEVETGDLLMLVLWGRHDTPVCAYADITWMAHVGEDIPAEQRKVFDLVVKARDAGLELVRHRYKANSRNSLEGWEVDKAVRDVIEAEGYGEYFPHRTGHNIGVFSGHGDGTHIDDLETHDTRPLIQGLCFSLEPGIYLADFGVRSGIDVYLSPTGPKVGSAAQTHLVVIPV